jgi:hypothetical protein
MPRLLDAAPAGDPNGPHRPPEEPKMNDTRIDALLRRHERDDRRLQWLLRGLVLAAMALVTLAWLGPIAG